MRVNNSSIFFKLKCEIIKNISFFRFTVITFYCYSSVVISQVFFYHLLGILTFFEVPGFFKKVPKKVRSFDFQLFLKRKCTRFFQNVSGFRYQVEICTRLKVSEPGSFCKTW